MLVKVHMHTVAVAFTVTMTSSLASHAPAMMSAITSVSAFATTLASAALTVMEQVSSRPPMTPMMEPEQPSFTSAVAATKTCIH